MHFRIFALLIVLGGTALPAKASDIRVQVDARNIVLSNLPVESETRRADAGGSESFTLLNPRLRSLAFRYAGWVEEAARTARVESSLVHAVIAAESGYDASAVSPRGAVGLMQVLPATAQRYGVSDLSEPRQNLRAGTRYLADLLRLFDNNLELAIAAYNAGENAVLRHGRRVPPFRETLAYVPRVLAYYHGLRSAAAGADSRGGAW